MAVIYKQGKRLFPGIESVSSLSGYLWYIVTTVWAKTSLILKHKITLLYLVIMCVLSHIWLFATLWLPHGLQPARLLCSWDCPDKNTGGGCPFFLGGSSRLRDWTGSPAAAILAGGLFITQPSRKHI